ncbi:craniofacial development protein 2-like [Schistocerca americana]|uniref:craniofacial development protein 2-like n=1 Tax=Schistocerca americana TaxID=7009 RepID=UPI001F5010FE|nr:craniofacial development protein 2-like [Schistocerca americana]
MALLKANENEKIDVFIGTWNEIRWAGHGVLDMGCWIIFLHGSESHHEFGTEFTVRQKFKLLTQFSNYSLIDVHAPTEVLDDQYKDNFFENLERTYDRYPVYNTKNAQIGKEDDYLPTIGKHSLLEYQNDNGHRVIQFALSRNMAVGSTTFPHKKIHKATWWRPDQLTFNQIDHVIIDGRHCSNVVNVHTYRGVNVDSDHYLVIAKL